MDKELIKRHLNDAKSSIDEALVELDVPDTGGNVTDLQAALDEGGDIYLKEGVTFEAPNGYQFKKNSSWIVGEENLIKGTSGPALKIPTSYIDGETQNVELAVGKGEIVVQVGRNDSEQTTLDKAPMDVIFNQVTVNQHRGKRVYEVNSRRTKFINCSVYDTYDPEKQDSQAIWIGNSPGEILIEGGHYEAASENILVGGDYMKIPECRPTGIHITGVELTKPMDWKGNSAIPVKTLLELKDGHDVLIESCKLSNCWQSGQDGWAFVFTPRNHGSLLNVVVKNCEVENVTGIVNIMGTDNVEPGTIRSQVTFDGGRYITNKTQLGGRGYFAMLQRGPEFVHIRNIYCRVDGNSFLQVVDNFAVDELIIENSDWNYGSYGVWINGKSHGDNSAGLIKNLVIRGNTITGANSSFKSRYPDNTYV